jgi:hypothetical protein
MTAYIRKYGFVNWMSLSMRYIDYDKQCLLELLTTIEDV